MAHKSNIHPAVARCRISEIESVCSALKMYVQVSYDLKLGFTFLRHQEDVDTGNRNLYLRCRMDLLNEYFYSVRKFSTKHYLSQSANNYTRITLRAEINNFRSLGLYI